jgi:hypothetical protein
MFCTDSTAAESKAQRHSATENLRPLCAERRSSRGSAYQLYRHHFDGSTGRSGPV